MLQRAKFWITNTFGSPLFALLLLLAFGIAIFG